MKKFLLILMTCALAMGLYAQPAGDAQPCPGLSTVTDYDGNIYNAVKIGTQCWMKQNLRTTHYANGGVIYSGGNSSSTTSPYYYNNSSSSIPLSYRGYLYNWAAVMHGASATNNVPSGVQGICPNGWHLPSFDEFWVLINYLRSQSYYYCGSNSSNIARALAYTSYWKSSSNSCAAGYTLSANNASGFSAVPAGFWCPLDNQGFSSDTHIARIWSTRQPANSSSYVNFFELDYNRSEYSDILNSGAAISKDWAASVRCVHTDPTVTTSSVSSGDIHPTWVPISYSVTYPYNDISITARGVCWSTSHNPTTANSHTSYTGTGSFLNTLTGLTPSTTYYVRAYATTSLGTVYSEEVSFTTPAFRNPTVTTSSVTNIGANSATCGGTIVDSYNDGINVTARGVCWSTSSYPTISNAHTSNGTGTGSFTSSITGLSQNTTYYVRAYATTSNGTVYGSQKSFRTICPTVNVSIYGNTTIYEGQSTTLTVLGANSYSWSNGSTGSSITVSPTSTTTYTVTGSNSCGNTGTASMTVTVLPVCLSCPEYDKKMYISQFEWWQFVNDTIKVSEGCRTYKIENVSNQYEYTFETGGAGSANFDTRLYLYDASCNQVAYNDDYTGYGRQSRLVFTPTVSGTYYLKVNGYNGASGNFSLAAQRKCATPIFITGDTVIRAGHSTTLTASGTGPYMWSDSSLGNSITVSPTTTTTYTVHAANVCGYYSEASVTVTVLPICQSCPDYDEEMSIGGTGEWSYVSDSTEVAYGCRTYKVYCSDQYKYTFETGGAGSADFDTRLILYNDSCSQVASNDDYAEYGTRSRIVFTPTVSGTYYLKVGGYSNRYGSFTLAAKRNNVPVVSTNSVTNISMTTATCGGNVTEEGYSAVTARGVCWSTSHNPTIADARTNDGTGTGAFTSSITGLVSGITYYVRAYATNSKGTAYGEEVSFSTPCPGDQCELTFVLTDNYGDGWNNNAIQVTDAETGTVLATLANVDLDGLMGYEENDDDGDDDDEAKDDTYPYMETQTITMPLCDGKAIIFNWVVGNYTEETSYTVYGGNGEEIFSGSGGFTGPISYTVSCASPCDAITLPYTENFDGYTTSTTAATGTEPTCWELVQSDVQMTDANRPQLYYKSDYAHSGKYSLLLNYRGVYAMPELSDEIPLNQVKLEMYLRQPKSYYALQVGVWEDNGGFVPVATFNNSGTGLEFVECDFSDYNGNGRRIAFRNISGDNTVRNYSYNYIDDINLTNNCEPITLPYTEDFDSYTASTTAATGVEPNCWNLVQPDVQMTDANRPQLYYKSSYAHSGNYSLLLNYRGVYAMPELSSETQIPINRVKLEMYVRQPKAYYQLEVGVWNGQMFVPVQRINNSTTEVEKVTVDFSGFEGWGVIAFRNVLADGYSYNYSYNYIDDITLTEIPEQVCGIIELPYTENFDSYTQSTTAETGVQPECWEVTHEDVALTNATKPQVYYNTTYATSGSYTLRMKNRCVYALPELRTNDPVSNLTMTFKLRQPKAVYRLQVGVVDAQGNFTSVKTINNSSTNTEEITVDFANYTGNGRRIAFRNTVSSSSTLEYSVNYIDDIMLDITPAACGIFELPYSENFDDYTASTTAETGVQPRCWEVTHEDVALTNATKPQVYYNATYATSGSYTLRMKNRCVYALPELNVDQSVNELTMTFKLRQPKAVYRLQVGVVDAQGNFTSVKTINNSSTETEDITVDFANYTGNGRRIAFRNTVSSSSTLDYSVNYIDDITLDITPAACGIFELPYSENFDEYTASTTAETGVQPRCWEVTHEDVALTNATKPQVYYNATYATSGSYTLRMKNRCVYALPELNVNQSVNELTMTFKLRQPKTVYRLQVGVVDAQDNFTLVKTINNSSTETEDITVDFANYTGNGRRIAFRNTVSSSSTLEYSVNYIDNIVLDLTPASCDISNLPYAENFDSYTQSTTAETGVQPNCWEVITEEVALTNATKPQVYYNTAYATSGSYTLRMKNRCVYALPELNVNDPVSSLTMTFKLRQPKTVYRLQVGVVDAQGNFTSVKTINNASTNMEEITVDFANYTGNGRRIAFRNTVSSSSTLEYSVNYIDDIVLVRTANNKSGEVTDATAVDALAADRDQVDVVVYPNPTKDVVNVQCTMNNAQCSGIEIVDVYGKIITTVGTRFIASADSPASAQSPVQINVSGLAAGMYFVRVTTDRGVVTKPFVKR